MLAWLGGKRRRNRLKAAAEARAARTTVFNGSMPSGSGRLPAPFRQHSSRLQEDAVAKEPIKDMCHDQFSGAEALISRTSAKSDTYADGESDAEAEQAITKQQRLTRKSSFSGAWAMIALGSSGNDGVKIGRKRSQSLASLDQRAIAMSGFGG